jgi:hypothetical protein
LRLRHAPRTIFSIEQSGKSNALPKTLRFSGCPRATHTEPDIADNQRSPRPVSTPNKHSHHRQRSGRVYRPSCLNSQ